MERGPQECPKWPGVRTAFYLALRRQGLGVPQAAGSVASAGSWSPAGGLVGPPHPRAARPHPPRPRAGPAPRAAPPLPRARRRPPRTPAEARGSGRLRAELQRWPDAKCKCKLLWKPRQASSESGARRSPGRRRIRPSHPGPRASAALRPRPEAGRGASGARHPAPEMPGMQMEQNLFSFCMARNVPGSACLNRLR